MQILLHCIWFGLPVMYFLIALWSKLEHLSGKKNAGDVTTYLKHGIFLLVCALLSLGFEEYFLEDLINLYLDPFVPLELARIILFPLVLLLAAKLIGGSKPIQLQSRRISKSKQRRK